MGKRVILFSSIGSLITQYAVLAPAIRVKVFGLDILDL